MTEIDDTFGRLQKTFLSGTTRSYEWRDAQLAALATLMTEERDAILGALVADVGKPIVEAMGSEFPMGELAHVRKELLGWMQAESISLPAAQEGQATAEIRHDPLGVTLIIGAWNYPFQLTLGPLIGAIAGGNAAVIKPSELTPNCAAVIARAVEKYLDVDAFAVVQGGIPETTELLKQKWDKIFFTGSPAVGKIVMRAAAENLVPTVLELGGKSPAIVAPDANLAIAATRIAWGKYFNAGQTCIGVDYALVHDTVYDDFVVAMKGKVNEFFGDDPASSKDFARIVNQANLERLVKLLDGQNVIAGGEYRLEERYLAPTLLGDVDPTTPVMTEEIFGPILPIMRYTDIDDAIAFVRAGEIPLAAYFFTEDIDLQEKLLAEIRSGGACINDALGHAGVPGAPFGGIGNSGMGSYHGKDSYLTFTHRRTVENRSTTRDRDFGYPPYPALG